MYKCMNCGKLADIDLRTTKKIICSHCGFRILLKQRSGISKKVIAR